MTKSNKPTKKTLARLLIVQSLYGYKIDQEDHANLFAEKILNQLQNQHFLNEIGLHKTPAVDKSFMRKLLNIVFSNIQEIEEKILDNLSEGWSLEKIDKVILCTLKPAVAEILYCADTPVKVIIDEYVTIAAGFYSGSEVGFVNGILDKIAKQARE